MKTDSYITLRQNSKWPRRKTSPPPDALPSRPARRSYAHRTRALPSRTEAVEVPRQVPVMDRVGVAEHGVANGNAL